MDFVGGERTGDRVYDLFGLSGLQERLQWVWFAVLAVLAEIGSVVMLRAVDAHRLTGHM